MVRVSWVSAAGSTHLPSVTMAPHLRPLVSPDFGAVDGASHLQAIVGALLTYGLIIAVLMVVICAVTWGLGSAHWAALGSPEEHWPGGTGCSTSARRCETRTRSPSHREHLPRAALRRFPAGDERTPEP